MPETIMWKHLIVLALCAGVARATLPPPELTRDLGLDSRGRAWSATFDHERGKLTSGATTYAIEPKPPLDYLSIVLHAIDRKDRALIADGTGRGVVVSLASGATEPLQLPKQDHGIASPKLAGDALWYIDSAPGDKAARVVRYDVGTGKADVVYPGEGHCDLHALALAGDTVWVAGSLRRDYKPTHALVLALDRTTGKVRAQAKEPQPTGEWFRIFPESAAICWVHSYSSVRRIDGSGKTRTWSVAPRSINNALVVDGKLALAFKTLDEKNSPPGMPRVTALGVGVIDPASEIVEIADLPGDWGYGHEAVEIARSGKDRITVAGRTFTLKDGHPVLEKK